MKAEEFLSLVLGTGAYYCVLGLQQEPRKRVQKFYTSHEDLIHATERMDANGLDAYFALATFKNGDTREGANAEYMKALFLDLDCGEEKDYDTQHEAITALRGFVKKVGLPRPLLVNSGRGVHVYWPLEKQVPAAEWLPVARALKKACATEQLACDSGVTADVARVLRIPGTHNHKDNPAKPVELFGGADAAATTPLADIKDILSPYADKMSAAPSLFDGAASGSVHTNETMQRLLGNQRSRFKDILQKSLNGKGCAQIAYAVTNQADVEEPLWRAMLSIGQFCSDRDKAIHAMSRKHPDYDPDETEDKASRAKGPYTCDVIDDLNPGVCDECPLRGRFKSPIVLGSYVEEANEEDNSVVVVDPQADTSEAGVVYQIPRYPEPYFRGKRGGVYYRTKDEEGDPIDVCIYQNDLYFVRRVFDEENGEAMLARVHLPNDGVREFMVSLVEATSKDDLRKCLASRGVAVNQKEWDRIMAYTKAWTDELQASAVADVAKHQFGWATDAMESFVVGDREIFGDHVSYNPPSPKTAYLFPAFEPKGTLEGWVDQANFYNRPGLEPWQFMICLSLGSPLMRMTQAHAAIFHMFSDDTGFGKTTTQNLALAAFGEPRSLRLNLSDTLNSQMNRYELFKDLPAQLDEASNMSPEDASDLVYGLTTGRQKARMSQGSNGERRRGAPWHLTLGISSNASFVSKILAYKAAPKAEMARLLEFHAYKHTFKSKQETDDFAITVGDHYGHAVEPFVQYIINNKETVKMVLQSLQERVDRAANLTMQERFWSVTAAVGLTALTIARELNLLRYDPKAMFDWVIEMINLNKRSRAEKTVDCQTLITDFVSEHYGSILWIKSTEDRRGENMLHGKGLEELVVPEQQPKVTFVARYETDLHRLYILPKPLRKWCSKQALNSDSLIKELSEKMDGKRKRMRIGKGTKFYLPPVDVISIDCSGLGLVNEDDEDGGSSD